MNLLYFNVIEENSEIGAEVFLNKSLLNKGVKTFNIDYRKNRLKLVDKILQLDNIDVLFLQRGDYFPLSVIKAFNIPKVFYFSELVSRRNDADHLFKNNIFDLYLVRSNKCKEILMKKDGLPESKIKVFLSSFTSKRYKPLNIKKEIDILFLGYLTPRRRKCLSELRELGNDIRIISSYGREANELINKSKIVINIHSGKHSDTETRVFETLGAKGFLITEKLGDENPFKHGEHLVECNDIKDMNEKIKYYLQNEKEREIISEKGCFEAEKNHTYDSRAKELIEMIKCIDVKNKSSNIFDHEALIKYKKKEDFLSRMGNNYLIKRLLLPLSRR